MEFLESIVSFLDNLVWNTPQALPFMIIMLLSYGIFITLRLSFIQVRRLGHGFKVMLGKYDDAEDLGDVNHFQALSTALSATVGIGNIAGVAIAIHYGGPGALFWMWVTAFFGMAVKFSECTLGVKYRKTNPDGSVSGGPMYYIENGLGSNWKWLAVTFAALAIICSFLTGNAVQANTVADVMNSSFGIPVVVTGLITATIVGFVIIGGIKRIGHVTARLTPLMALIYVFGALVILLINYDQVLPAFGTIFTYAFDPVAGAYGVGSGLFMTTMVWGIKRGLFSNEAGQGSSPIAMSASKTKEPVQAGLVGLLGPFIDTLVVCTMTGLVIIATGVWDDKHPATINMGGGEVAFVIDGTAESQNVLFVEDGIIQNGTLIRNDFSVDTLYATSDLSVLFTGRIVTTDNRYAEDADGIRTSSLYGNTIYNGAPLTGFAFEKGLSPLFPGGSMIVTISVLLFAISTSISWSYYGDRSSQYLFGDRAIIWYKFVYIGMHFVGAVVTLETIWAIGDIALGLMTFPNLIALFALSGVVYKSSKEYFKKMDEADES